MLIGMTNSRMTLNGMTMLPGTLRCCTLQCHLFEWHSGLLCLWVMSFWVSISIYQDL